MIKISVAQLWVHDQDEALAFYTEKLGMEVRTDATLPEMGDFRWLTVGPPGQDEISIVLMAIPGEPVMDAGTAEQVRELSDIVMGRVIELLAALREESPEHPSGVPVPVGDPS